MSIAEKLTTVAENQEKVYKAGQSSMVDESKIIEKTVTGTNVVVIDDTSEIPHDVGCKVESVNLFGLSKAEYELSWRGKKAEIIDVVDENNFTIVNKNSDDCLGVYISGLDVTKTYSISATVTCIVSTGETRGFFGFIKSDVPITEENTKSSAFIYKQVEVAPGTTQNIILEGLTNAVSLGVSVYDNRTFKIENLMICESPTALPYTPYVDVSNIAVMRYGESAADNLETYTVNADGTVDGIKSLCPVMTLSTDVEGVELTVDYHKSWGKQAEYDAFWDAYQDNGNRKNYEVAFIEKYWSINSLKPKYNMQPTNASKMFYKIGYDNNIIFDLRGMFETSGVTLDFSKATNMNYCFQTSKIKYLGVVDLRNCGSNLQSTFGNMYNITEIEKVIVCENNTFPNTFDECWASKIIFEGVIAANIKLNRIRCGKEGFESIINCLSTTVTDKTITLGLSNIKKAFETASGANDGNTSEEWLTLAATKPNWTITLA